MKKVFFISDAHLQNVLHTGEMSKREKLASFFEMVRQEGSALYVVGDLFDFWFEYKRVITKDGFWGAYQLKLLVDAGIEIHLIAGNHDYWMRDFFSKEIGVFSHKEPLSVKIFGKNIFLIHGDGLSDLDARYRILRRILRNTLNIFLFRWLHPDLGIALANRWSHRSAMNDAEFKKYLQDESYLKQVHTFFDRGHDVVIMGHHHVPRELIFGNKRCYTLGDWITHFTYVEMDEDTMRLRKW